MPLKESGWEAKGEKGAESKKKRNSSIWFWRYITKRRLQPLRWVGTALRTLLVQKLMCSLGSQHSSPSGSGLLSSESGMLGGKGQARGSRRLGGRLVDPWGGRRRGRRSIKNTNEGARPTTDVTQPSESDGPGFSPVLPPASGVTLAGGAPRAEWGQDSAPDSAYV